MVIFRTVHTIRLETNTKAPMATMPTSWVTKDPDPKIPTASVPHMPQTR